MPHFVLTGQERNNCGRLLAHIWASYDEKRATVRPTAPISTRTCFAILTFSSIFLVNQLETNRFRAWLSQANACTGRGRLVLRVQFLSVWRRDRDSNPGWAHTHNGFRDRPVRPLRHLSASVVVVGPGFSRSTGVVQHVFSWARRL